MESNQTTERKTYHEQKYIDNTLRLREILKTLPALQKIISVLQNLPPLQKQEFLMHMISGYSFTF